MSPIASDSPYGVLLLAHGGPDSLDEMEPFLLHIRGGRPVTAHLLEDIRGRYRQIGGCSPLLGISRRQAQALEQELRGSGIPARVYLGMRNWHPFIRETMAEIACDAVGRLVALCLAPQNSRMSVGLYFQRVREAQQELQWKIPISYVESWHQESLLLEAYAEKLLQALATFPDSGSPPTVIFTAHSLPEKILAAGDPYDRQCRETAAAVAGRCGLADWKFAYQSQGATEDSWLGPTVESLLEEASRAGSRRVLLVPIGFVADHVEVLYDIDIAFQQLAEARGILLRRTESLNDSPTFIRALASVVRQHLAETEPPSPSGREA